MVDEITFESLDYGAYRIEHPSGSFSEDVKVTSAVFNKIYTQRVRLPEGKGNVIYLLSDTFENALKMTTSNYFYMPASYRRLYYPQWYVGRFMNKRIRLSTRQLFKERSKLITQNTRLKPYQARTLTQTYENIMFSTTDILNQMQSIMQNFTIKRNYMEFFPEFTKILKALTPDPKDPNKDATWNNRLMIIDVDALGFKMGGDLKSNKTNPLFLLYLAFLKTHNLSKLDVDMDMLIVSKNLFLKFNPKTLNDMRKWTTFRMALFRMMNVNLDNYTASLTKDEQQDLEVTSNDHTIQAVVKDIIEPYVKDVSPSTKAVLAASIEDKYKKAAADALVLDDKIKAAQQAVAQSTDTKDPTKDKGKDQFSALHANPVKDPLSDKAKSFFKSTIGNYEPIAKASGLVIDDDYDEEDDIPDEDTFDDEYETDVKDDVREILATDEDVATEVLDEIQNKTVPMNDMKTAPVNSARDKKLREEQKKVVVKDSTIEEILARDSANVPIESSDKSAVMHTSNKNMHNITFANFDKTYIDKLYTKDLLAAFDSLKDKNSPFYITGIDIKDTSDNLNLKETWTVHLTDENKKRHTITVDIPKFYNDRFLLINGTKFMILKQNFYNPLVKDTPDTVILTTNYNKITIQRKATRSLNSVERVFSLIRKTGDKTMFIPGNSTMGNMKYISTLEYDELSKVLFKFQSDSCTLYFSRDYLKENIKEPTGMNDNEFFIGYEGKNPIFINEDTGYDRTGRTITQIIQANLPENYQHTFESIKGPTQSMYVEGKLAGEFLPVIATLIVWVGLTETLSKMKIRWNFIKDSKKINTPGMKYIRFANGQLEYELTIAAELILNGLAKMHPEKYQFEDFDTEIGYDDYIYSIWGSYNGINELKTFYEFLLDPITKEYCKDLMLPDDPVGLMIHAVELLADNAYVSKSSDKSYRTRSIEIISGILYSCLASQYKAYVKRGRKGSLTLNQKCVIQNLIAEKTVEAYSTLNPVIEVSKAYTISAKGYKGSNSVYSYKDEEKRSYDPTSVGKLAVSTSADANVGINKQLVVEPTISNARGYRDPIDSVDQLKDVNIFAPVEMLTPGTARFDDPIRTAIQDWWAVAV